MFIVYLLHVCLLCSLKGYESKTDFQDLFKFKWFKIQHDWKYSVRQASVQLSLSICAVCHCHKHGARQTLFINTG
jgi:hypothetical protein